ncbi:MAG TPA: FtsW/RodA/SpoVE family cell cycle protein [Candidatus Limnocylindria bacterium]|nr:FtsW/RodA/SpoVE family cell cycle protein [Candidatus Limnocylindria bacterium]
MNQFEDKRSRQHFDVVLLIAVYALMLMGVIAIAVATFNPDVSADLPLLNRILASDTGSWQAIFVIASLVVVWFIVSVPYEHFKNYAELYYIGIVAFLLAVLITSSAIREVKAWFQLSLGRMLQPSEFAKLTLILMLSKELQKTSKPMGSLRSVMRIGVITMLPASIIILQGETGSVLVLLGMSYLLLFFAGVDWKWIAGIGLTAVLGVAGIFAYGIIGGGTNYRLLRILSFIDPYAYNLSEGYQSLRSQQAIGAGGLTGVGLFVPGSMSQLNFVPEDWTDFIFATIGEAVGFVGSALIVLLMLFIVLRMLYLSRYTYDKFGRLIIVGVMAMLFLHTLQNIAMTVGLMPITGIPLPFLSYGGSNLLTNVIGVAMVLNVTRNRSAVFPTYNVIAGSALRKRGARRKPIYVNTSGDGAPFSRRGRRGARRADARKTA